MGLSYFQNEMSKCNSKGEHRLQGRTKSRETKFEILHATAEHRDAARMRKESEQEIKFLLDVMYRGNVAYETE